MDLPEAKTTKCYLFCYLSQLSTEKESLRFKGSVINTGSLFSGPNNKKGNLKHDEHYR